jgi:hypothetical protein
MAGRNAYAGLVDEQVLEFLYESLVAFSLQASETLAHLEGAASLLDRLRTLFPAERLDALEAMAGKIAGKPGSHPSTGARAPERPRTARHRPNRR